MMCQDISTFVAASMYASSQANPHPPGGRGIRFGRGGGVRGVMVVRGGDLNQVEFPVNCNRCGKAGHYVWYCPKCNVYWDPPPSATEDTATKLYHNKGAKSDVTMSYLSV